jgi:hypothetical protein
MFFDLATVANATSNNLQLIVTSTHLKKSIVLMSSAELPFTLTQTDFFPPIFHEQLRPFSMTNVLTRFHSTFVGA